MIQRKHRRELPDAETLRALLDYDPGTGALTWKERPDNLKFNSQLAGKPALTARRCGYLCGNVLNVLYQTHRVAWKIHYGEEPPDQIDHCDGDGMNNAVHNMRAATNQQNATNRKPYSRTLSGKLGVCRDARSGKWRAYITVDGKQLALGVFSTKAKAVAARERAEKKHGFLSAVSKPRRMKSKASADPTAEQKGYWDWLREHIGACEACGRRVNLVIHHLLADLPPKQHRRDHWFVVLICSSCHNGQTNSIHLLGSEVLFMEVHGVDLIAVSQARLKEWGQSER